MRLLSIGTSPQSNIILQGQFVSRNHAELIQLDNGDMLIVDKGSSNGTYVNGNRITPETEVTVTTNDTIQLADQVLSWSMVPPQPPIDTNAKVLKGIGTHYRNTIRIQGPHVSRFHATIKQLKNGKWYICDHSTNGTTLNGQRIPRDQYVPLKKKDVISCAGTIVVNPVTNGGGGGSALKGIALGLCACLLVGLCAWGIKTLIDGLNGGSNYASSTVMIDIQYYYRARINLLGHSIDRRFGVNKNGVVVDIEDYGARMLGGSATGFFISENGCFVTNNHVAEPWKFGEDKEIVSAIKEKLIEDFLEETKLLLASADVHVDGVLHSITIVPNGYLYDKSNQKQARLLVSSDNQNIDLAIMQTMDQSLPKGSTYVPMSAIADYDVEQGKDILSWGFPIPDQLQDRDNWEKFVQKNLQAVLTNGKITKVDTYNYLHNADSFHGASGSPVFDKKGKLLGVISSGYGYVNYNHCVKSKYLLRLYDKWVKENN